MRVVLADYEVSGNQFSLSMSVESIFRSVCELRGRYAS